jgi:hypothetical protein
MAEPASSSTTRGSGSGSKKPDDLDDLLQRLGIDEDEIDDLIFEDTDLPKEGIKWMALARVHTTNWGGGHVLLLQGNPEVVEKAKLGWRELAMVTIWEKVSRERNVGPRSLGWSRPLCSVESVLKLY